MKEVQVKKLRIWLEWDGNRSEEFVELPEGWAEMDGRARSAWRNDCWADHMGNTVNGGTEIVEVDE